jgi:plastocyanin
MNVKQCFSAAILLAALAAPLGRLSAADGGASGGASPSIPGAGSVAGHVKFTGTTPKSSHISMASDPSCHGSASAGEEFVTGANGTLGNVVVYVSDGLGNRTFDVPADPVVMQQKGCMYEPHVVGLRANQRLRITNNDGTTHNIHPVPTNNREWNKAQPGGTVVEETFAREEVAIPLKCNVHPWMRSYIAVFKHPYFAVTGKDGSFDLTNLPPGEYTIQAWHEKLGTLKQKITIAAGENKSVDFVFKTP